MRAICRIAIWLSGMVIAALLPSLTALNANAASFDCAKATSAEEKAICADSELSALDERLAADYGEALSKLSPESQKVFREGQKEWIKFLRAACKPTRQDLKGFPTCIKNAYEARREDFTNPFQIIGPFKFLRLVRYAFAPVLEQTNQAAGCGRESVGYFGGGYISAAFLRIDSSKTPATTKWNDLMTDEAVYGIALRGNSLKKVDPCLDLYVKAEVIGASRNVISTYFYNEDFCHDCANHSISRDGRVLNTLLDSRKSVREYDVFNPETAWVEFLTCRAKEKLNKKQKTDDEFSEDVIREGVEDPHRWGLTPQGLKIFFNLYDLDGPKWVLKDVTFSWAELQPYLRKPLPFQLPQ